MSLETPTEHTAPACSAGHQQHRRSGLIKRSACSCGSVLSPEREGWVDREKLHDITGRSRKPQIAMAEQFGFDDYSQPAGGCCFLTDKSYSAKLVDLWKSQGHKEYELDDVMLLKVGRHIRPQPNFKLIVAREEGEGRFLQGYKNEFISMISLSHRGPLALIDGTPSAEDLYLAAQITARFGQGREADQVDINVTMIDGSERTLQVKPIRDEDMPKAWYV